jgi:hypothetical protein
MVVVTHDGKLAYVTTLALPKRKFWRRRAAGLPQKALFA